MRKKSKTVLSTILVSCMVLSMAACSGGNEDLVSEGGSGSGDDQVKLVFLRAGTEDYKKEAFTKMIEGFE